MFTFLALRREISPHKLRYSKTLKGDAAGAFLGLVVGLFVGYLALSSVGACSIDLSDLTVVLWYSGLIVASLATVSGGLRPNISNLLALIGWSDCEVDDEGN